MNSLLVRVDRCDDALKDAPRQVQGGKRVVSIIEPDTVLELGGRYVFVRPDRDGLAALTQLVEDGHLSVTIAETFPLERIAEAHRLSEEGHPRGKVVVTL